METPWRKITLARSFHFRKESALFGSKYFPLKSSAHFGKFSKYYGSNFMFTKFVSCYELVVLSFRCIYSSSAATWKTVHVNRRAVWPGPLLSACDPEGNFSWHGWCKHRLYWRFDILLKYRHFWSKKTFNKLIYGVNTIINCGIWRPVKCQLVSRFWSGSKLKWFISYIWINVGNINSEIR